MNTTYRWLLVAALALGGCLPVYTCSDDGQCAAPGKEGGRCVASDAGSYCAFPSAACAPRLAWDGTAPPALRGTCVDVVCRFDDNRFDDGCVFGP